MVMNRIFCIVASLCFIFPAISEGQVTSGDSLNAAGQRVSGSTSLVAPSINEPASVAFQKAHNTGSLQDFPRLHPLIVHFPIVFIILAFITQIVSFFVFKKEMSWVTMSLTVLGFIGAYVATNILHGGDPDLAALSDIARETFERHEHFAHLTEWFSGTAAVAKIFSHFFLKRNWWSGLLAVILMGCATYTIVVAGDMGARLVHIDEIGVQYNQIPAQDMD